MINILVPTDFSAAAKKALEYAVFVAKKTNANVVILHIYQIPVITVRGKPFVPDPEIAQANLHLAEEQLKNLEKKIVGLKEISYITKTLAMYWLIELPEIIQEQNADLIIMGTNGASRLREIVLGSNTARVITNAKCPVFAVPVDAKSPKIEKMAFAYDKEFVENLTTFDFLIWFTKRFNALLEVFYIRPSEQDSDSTQQLVNTHHLKQYLKEIPHSHSEIAGDNIDEYINKYLLEKNIDVLVMMHRSHSLFERLFRSSFSKKMAYHTLIPLLVIPEKE